MKKFIYLFAGVCMFSSCNEKKAEDTPVAETKVPPVYAYPVRYTDWEIGNAQRGCRRKSNLRDG